MVQEVANLLGKQRWRALGEVQFDAFQKQRSLSGKGVEGLGIYAPPHDWPDGDDSWKNQDTLPPDVPLYRAAVRENQKNRGCGN